VPATRDPATAPSTAHGALAAPWAGHDRPATVVDPT
jgi:hypothetical protein